MTDHHDDLVEKLIPVAHRLAALVHRRDQPGVAVTLDKINPRHKDALLVVLAGMVDPRCSPSELLVWLHRRGPPLVTPARADGNRRALARAAGVRDDYERTER